MMDELIRKQTVLNMIDNLQFGDCGTATERLTKLYDAVENQPSADAVEVVRCGECKWCNTRTNDCHNPRFGDGWANYPPPCVREDFFCTDGERKTDG